MSKKKNIERLNTQRESIKNYIKRFGSITQLEALRDLGVMRLASRISELRLIEREPIVGVFESIKNRFGKFTEIKRYMYYWDAEGEKIYEL
jgi:hypothetical protein